MNCSYTVVTTLGGIYTFRAQFHSKETAMDCATRASKETPEPVDVYKDDNCIEMFRGGKKY